MLRGGKWLTGVGVGFLVISLLWLVFAVPALVRYPLDVDATPIYEGKFTLFVDANTFAPLDTPQVLPLKVTRHIDALGSKSSYSKVVVSEKIDFDAGGQFSQKQDNQYVMDRRSMKNVQSDDAYAFTSDNVVDRSPAFRLNFPLDTDANSEYLIYKNETASTYTAGPDPVEPKLEVDGLHLVAFAASSKPTPISPAYIALLSQSVPLPKTLTITQLDPVVVAGRDRRARHAHRASTGDHARRPHDAHQARVATDRAPVSRHVQRRRRSRADDGRDRRRAQRGRDGVGDGRARGVTADHRRARRGIRRCQRRRQRSRASTRSRPTRSRSSATSSRRPTRPSRTSRVR